MEKTVKHEKVKGLGIMVDIGFLVCVYIYITFAGVLLMQEILHHPGTQVTVLPGVKNLPSSAVCQLSREGYCYLQATDKHVARFP